MSVDEDARWLEWVTKQFESIAGDDKEINLCEFKTALKVKEVRSVLFLRTKELFPFRPNIKGEKMKKKKRWVLKIHVLFGEIWYEICV